MKSMVLKHAVIGAVLALSVTAANAQSVTFNYNYLAGASVLSASTATTTNTGNLAASSSAGYSLGTITFTDLADLNLGDGKTGVRTSLNLNFAPISSGTGSIYASAFETNFLGTSTAGVGGIELNSLPNTVPSTATNLGNNINWRYVSGTSLSNLRAGGAVEFAEDGNVNGWGVAAAGQPADPSFEQENNFAAGAMTSGTSVIDFLNGDNGYNGFSVAQMLANPVNNNSIDALNPNERPDAFSWLKIRSTNGGIADIAGRLTATNNTTRISTQSLNILAIEQIAAVPEPETYAMMLAGLGLIVFSARRRKTA